MLNLWPAEYDDRALKTHCHSNILKFSIQFSPFLEYQAVEQKTISCSLHIISNFIYHIYISCETFATVHDILMSQDISASKARSQGNSFTVSTGILLDFREIFDQCSYLGTCSLESIVWTTMFSTRLDNDGFGLHLLHFLHQTVLQINWCNDMCIFGTAYQLFRKVTKGNIDLLLYRFCLVDNEQLEWWATDRSSQHALKKLNLKDFRIQRTSKICAHLLLKMFTGTEVGYDQAVLCLIIILFNFSW